MLSESLNKTLPSFNSKLMKLYLNNIYLFLHPQTPHLESLSRLCTRKPVSAIPKHNPSATTTPKRAQPSLTISRLTSKRSTLSKIFMWKLHHIHMKASVWCDNVFYWFIYTYITLSSSSSLLSTKSSSSSSSSQSSSWYTSRGGGLTNVLPNSCKTKNCSLHCYL